MDELTREERRTTAVEEAALAVMDTLGDYPAYLWGDVLAEVVAAVFTAKIDAAEIGLEQRAVEKMRGGGGLNPPPPREN